MDVRIGLWRELSTKELMLSNCKDIQPVNPKGNQSWTFIGRIDAEAETPIVWPPDVKNWLIWKDPDAGKDWRWEDKGTTEDEMVRWHDWLDGHEFEHTPGVGDGQGSLACCSPWGCKESDTTEQLNWTESSMREQRQMWGLRLVEYLQRYRAYAEMYVIPLSFDSKCPKNCFEWLFSGKSLDCEKLYERTCIHLVRPFLKQI